MSAEEKEDYYQIDGAHILHDAMDIICKYISGKDLSNVAKVCKSWYRAALRERNRRYFVQYLRLPYKIDNLTNALDVFPAASLLCYDLTLEKSLSLPIEKPSALTISNGLEEELLQDFEKQLPNETVILSVDEYFATENVQVQDAKKESDLVPCSLDPSGNCDILGLFFPSVERRVRVHFARIPEASRYPRNPEHLENVIDRVTEELGLNDCGYPKSTILLLVGYFRMIDCDITTKLGRRIQRTDKQVTFANIFGRKLLANNCNGDIHQNNFQYHVLLRISGPSVESWSTFIHYLAGREEIERKLHRLKEQVKRKRHYNGLVYSPKCVQPGCDHNRHPCGNSHEMMCNLMRIFPGIRFTGFFLHYDRYATDEYDPNLREIFRDQYDENDTFKRSK